MAVLGSVYSPNATTLPEVVSAVKTGRKFCPMPLGDHSTRRVCPNADPALVASALPTPVNTSGSSAAGTGRLTPAKAHKGPLMAGSGRMMPLAVRVSANWGWSKSSSPASSGLFPALGYSGRKMWMVSSVAMASSASQDQEMACGASGRALNSSGSSGRACLSVSLCEVFYEDFVHIIGIVRKKG